MWKAAFDYSVCVWFFPTIFWLSWVDCREHFDPFRHHVYWEKGKMAEQFKKPRCKRNCFSLQYEFPLGKSSRLTALKARFDDCKARWQVQSNAECLERVLEVVELMQSSPASPSSPTPSPFLVTFTPPQSRYAFSSTFSPGQSPFPSPSPPSSVAVTPPTGMFVF